jgi:hypothetical protein
MHGMLQEHHAMLVLHFDTLLLHAVHLQPAYKRVLTSMSQVTCCAVLRVCTLARTQQSLCVVCHVAQQRRSTITLLRWAKGCAFFSRGLLYSLHERPGGAAKRLRELVVALGAAIAVAAAKHFRELVGRSCWCSGCCYSCCYCGDCCCLLFCVFEAAPGGIFWGMRAGVTNAECNAFRNMLTFLAPAYTHKHCAFAMQDANMFDMVGRALKLLTNIRHSSIYDVVAALKRYNDQNHLMASEECVFQAAVLSTFLQPAVNDMCIALVGAGVEALYSSDPAKPRSAKAVSEVLVSLFLTTSVGGEYVLQSAELDKSTASIFQMCTAADQPLSTQMLQQAVMLKVINKDEPWPLNWPRLTASGGALHITAVGPAGALMLYITAVVQTLGKSLPEILTAQHCTTAHCCC